MFDIPVLSLYSALMYDLANFMLSDGASCSMALRKAALGADSMEDVAICAVRFLYRNLYDFQNDTNACALVRIFKTHPYDDLDGDLKSCIDRTDERNVSYFPGMRCMVLLASAGDETEWNDRRTSKNHRLIPLPSPAIVNNMPHGIPVAQAVAGQCAHANRAVFRFYFGPPGE